MTARPSHLTATHPLIEVVVRIALHDGSPVDPHLERFLISLELVQSEHLLRHFL